MADKVLIIDDMELNRDMLSVILEGEYEIEVAEDGDLGIQKLKVNKDSKYFISFMKILQLLYSNE